jgi:signal transduction histidine kinase
MFKNTSKTIFLFLILLSNLAFAQSDIDSLVNQLPNIQNPKEKADLLNTLCLRLVYSYPDSALQFGKQSLKIGKENTSELIQGKAFNRIGIVYDVINKWDTALIFYDSAIQSAHISNDSVTIASAYNNIGLVYWNQSIYDKAIESFMASLNLFEMLGKDKGVANTYNNIGLIYSEQDREDEALKYHFKSLEKRLEINDESGIYDSWLNIATNYYGLINMDSANYYYLKTLPYFIKQNNHYALGVCYNGLGEVNRYWKKKEMAISYFNKSIESHLKVHNYYKAASSLIGLSKLYHAFDDYEHELKVLLQAKEILKNHYSLRIDERISYLLANVYANLGHYSKSSQYYKEHIHLNDSLYTLDRDEAIEVIMIAYETEKKEQALEKEKIKTELLEKENDLSQIKIDNRNRWLFAVASLSLAVIFFLLFLNQRRIRKAQAEKNEAVLKEREKGIKAVFNAQEEERARIAKDLHDGVGQQMSAIKLQLSKIGSELKNPYIEHKFNRVIEIVSQTANNIRSISHQMMPTALNDLGLVLALEDLLNLCFSNTAIKYHFDAHGMEKRLPKHIEIALYRIAQELFNNIIKHSNAKSIDVQLIKTETHCIFMVYDDGVGIAEKEKTNGYGVLNMISRLNTINGDLNLESDEGRGTTATIKIALNG